MGNIILRGGAKNNENKFTTTNLVKAGVKSLFFSDTQYKVTKYTRNIVEYTKKLNTTKIDIQKNMSNMLVNDKFLYNIDNMQNKFLKPLIDVINSLGRKTSLVEQDKKKFKTSVLYINTFIRKNKNPSCNIQLLEKYKSFACILKNFRALELKFYHIYYKLTKNILKLIEVDYDKYYNKFESVFNEGLSEPMFKKYHNMEGGINATATAKDKIKSAGKTILQEQGKEAKSQNEQFYEKTDKILTKCIEITTKYLQEYVDIFRQIEILGIVPRDHYNIIYEKYPGAFSKLKAKLKIGELLSWKSIYHTYGKLVIKDSEIRPIYEQILKEFNTEWKKLDSKYYTNGYNAFNNAEELNQLTNKINNLACIHPEIQKFYLENDLGFTSDKMNATPCNHFLDNIHLWDIPYVMNTYISLKTGDNEIYGKSTLKPYFPYQIINNYKKGDDAYKNYEDTDKAKIYITFKNM